MSNPLVVQCLADVWTLVVSNSTSALINVTDLKPRLYLQTYRVAGDPFPIGKSDAVNFLFGSELQLSVGLAVDVYVMAVGKNGAVRVGE